MSGRQFLASFLLVLGILGLLYGGVAHTSNRQYAQTGPVEVALKDERRLNLPLWVGVALALVGGVMLLMRPKTEPVL